MNLSSTARSPFPGTVQIGSIADKWHRNEPLFAGTQVGESAATVRDAIANAAGALPDHVGLVAVSRVDGGFASFQVSQPVWDGNFFSEQAVGLEPARLQPAVGTDSANPRFEGSKLRYVDGYRQELQRTGPVRLDAVAGVEALVGITGSQAWTLQDGELSNMTIETKAPRPVPVPAPDEPAPAPDEPAPAPTEPAPAPAPGKHAPAGLVQDLTEAVRLAQKSADIITKLPQDDTGTDATKEQRIQAYKTNMASQSRLERQFNNGLESAIVSTMRTADASLEDANWQLAKKPSPDGRFNGVDIPGALSDTTKAVDILKQLLDEQLKGGQAEGAAAGAAGIQQLAA